MHHTVISVENLSKAYRIGLKEEIPDTLTAAFIGFAKAPLKKLRELQRLNTFRHSGDAEDIVWALKDVSFEVREGEVLGVIGRNGAGKSTLLKILSRITEPTSGRAVIRGRVSSLLEVGTGFHPELSGRENVYLNGTILGMTKPEIDQKFDEIVDFSGVEKFLDTPIKRYSSGMKVRLAFAVAAHLEPEILIIDEVLAVGDAEFQKKCLGKMQDVARSGRTVLFVSHNMAAVENLCDFAVVLSHGALEYCGATDDAIMKYFANVPVLASSKIDLVDHPSRRRGCLPLLREIRMYDQNGESRTSYRTGESMTLEFLIEPLVPLPRPQIGVGVDDGMGTRLFSVATSFSQSTVQPIHRKTRVRCQLDHVPLIHGRYFLSISVGNGQDYLIDAIDHAVAVDFDDSDFFGNGRSQPASLGRIAVNSRWTEVDEVNERS